MNAKEIIGAWKKQPWQFLSTLGVLTGILCVCFSFLVVQANLNNVLSRWGSEFKVNVYLNDDISKADQEALLKEIKEQKIFKSVDYLSKDSALDKFKARLGFLGTDIVADGSLENPLPASFEATIDTKAASFLALLKDFSEVILKRSYVEDVSYGHSWVENYASFVQGWQMVGALVALILAAGALLLSASTIRSSIFHRRDEIEIMELFGATRWMISKPFVTEGAILGFTAGLLASFIVFFMYTGVVSFLKPQLEMWNLNEVVSFAPFLTTLGFILFCVALGCAGSLIGVRQINTGWAAAERQ